MKKTNGQRRLRWRPLATLLALAALGALVLAGCGGSSGGSETATAASASGSSSDQGEGPGGFQMSAETTECLQEQGVNLPEPGEGGGPPEGEGAPPAGEPPAGGEAPGFGGAQSEEMQEAFEACGIEAPQGGPGGAPDTDSASFRESVKEYAACVRENGYDMPEPDFSGDGPVFDESEVDREDPDFKSASAKCQDALGQQGGQE